MDNFIFTSMRKMKNCKHVCKKSIIQDFKIYSKFLQKCGYCIYYNTDDDDEILLDINHEIRLLIKSSQQINRSDITFLCNLIQFQNLIK